MHSYADEGVSSAEIKVVDGCQLFLAFPVGGETSGSDLQFLGHIQSWKTMMANMPVGLILLLFCVSVCLVREMPACLVYCQPVTLSEAR